MAVSKSLIMVLAVLVVGIAAGGVAASDHVQKSAAESPSNISQLDMDAALDNETVTVTVTDDGEPVENASVTVEGENAVMTSTNGDGIATINRSALTEDGEPLHELELEYESADVEGELEYLVQDDSLTLIEESYEYDIEDGEEKTEHEGEKENGEDDDADDEEDEFEDDEAEVEDEDGEDEDGEEEQEDGDDAEVDD